MYLYLCEIYPNYFQTCFLKLHWHTVIGLAKVRCERLNSRNNGEFGNLGNCLKRILKSLTICKRKINEITNSKEIFKEILNSFALKRKAYV